MEKRSLFFQRTLSTRWARLSCLAIWSTVLAFPAISFAAQDGAENDRVLFGSKLQQRISEYKRPAVIRFDGEINVKSWRYLKNRIARAKSEKIDLLIVEIDSPGGLAHESGDLAEILRDIDWAYTVAYVRREAISGAALFSMGCDEIIMETQARIGDIGVIHFDSQLFAFRYAPAKIISYLSRQAQDIAAAKGRPREIAEAMVDKDVLVFEKTDANGLPLEFKTVRMQNEGQTPNEAAREAGLDINEWTLVEESGPERFVTLNSEQAVRLGIASTSVADRAALLAELNATGTVTEYEINMTDEVVYWLNTGLVTALLIIVGLIALYIEFSAPGIGAGGLIAGLCAVLFFWSRFLGGTSGWLEVILFLAGLLFLIMEVFVIPGWGVSGFLGLLMVFGSVLMAGQEFVVPQDERQWSQLATSLLILLCSGCIVLIGATVVSRRLGTIPVFNRLILQPTHAITDDGAEKSDGKPVPTVHPVVSIGDWGVTESLLRPAGRVLFAGQSFDVVSDGEFIDPGVQVRVLEISGNRIVVASVESLDETVASPSKE